MRYLCKNGGSCFDKLMCSRDACSGKDIYRNLTDFHIIAQQFPNRSDQIIIIIIVNELSVPSGVVSDLFIVYLDDKGQTILVIWLQFFTLSLSKRPNNAFL